MTPEEVKEYGERVEAMAKKQPAYEGWGFFYFRAVDRKTKELFNNIDRKNKEYFNEYADKVSDMEKQNRIYENTETNLYEVKKALNHLKKLRESYY